MKKLIGFTIMLMVFGCAPHKKTNKLASKLRCDRNFFLSYDARSDFEGFKYTGEHYGKSKFPDFKKTFIKSIVELNNDTQMDVKFVESTILPSSSNNYAKVRIEEIRWNWKFSSAELEVDLQYEINEEKIYITGKNKIYLVGTKRGSLYKALKNGHYLFINALCSQ